MATPTESTNGTAATFNVRQPSRSTMTPDENDESTIVTKMARSFTP